MKLATNFWIPWSLVAGAFWHKATPVTHKTIVNNLESIAADYTRFRGLKNRHAGNVATLAIAVAKSRFHRQFSIGEIVCLEQQGKTNIRAQAAPSLPTPW